MATIIIRDIDESVALKLTDLAKKKKMSRESYLRNALTSMSISGELFEMDFKYASLVETLADKNQMMADIIDKNNYLLEEVLEELNNDKKEE